MCKQWHLKGLDFRGKKVEAFRTDWIRKVSKSVHQPLNFSLHAVFMY